jgi:group I intron endonuclease
LVSLYKGTPLLYNAEIFVAVKQLRKPWLFYTFEKVYRIYKITNKLNGKSYIGLTGLRDIHHRWNIHIKNYHGTRIGRAIRKYGVDNFVFEVIDVTSSLDRANILEKRYIREFGTMVPMGYNMTAGGEGVEISASSRIRGVETRRMNSPDSWKEAAATNIRNDPKFYSKIGTHKVRTPTLKVRADGSYYVGRS